MNLRSIRYHLPFLIILILALFLRLNRLAVLTTFGRDQGIDFSTVKKMIVDHKPTLIGIEVSIAQFHQGPIYLYVLMPLFVLMKFNPIAGAYTAVLVSAATIVALYLTTQTFFGRKLALLSCGLFALSPEFVREGNTPLYQHFLPLFILIALYALLKLSEKTQLKNQSLWSLFLGFTAGICLEIHFLAITFALAILIILITQHVKKPQLILLYLVGLVAGVSPTLLFELKHQFLNTHLLWSYLTSTHSSMQTRTLLDWIAPWLDAQTKWFGADIVVLGVLVFLYVLYTSTFIHFKNPSQRLLRHLILITTTLTLFFEIGIQDFQAHYLLPVLVMELILFPVWISQLKLMLPIGYLAVFFLLLINAVAIIRGSTVNHGYFMSDGWSLQKIQSAAQLIALDAQDREHINVASLIDGDARTYALRYSLDAAGVLVDSPENYSRSTVLYLVSRTGEQEIAASTLWEITSFQPFVITQHWDLEDGIQLYRLEKNNEITSPPQSF